ncbi:MAG: sulfite exporter TauE/SafE family protein, partial [Alphaproteobacteria bacterium]|nr:sulfite exporter TauE/SafE family protein [Alphaproteobacteria bacterium]
MSFASETSPPVGAGRSAASIFPRSVVSGLAQRVSLPLLVGLIIAGFIAYCEVAGATVGRLAVFAGIFVAGMVSGVSGLAFPLIAGPIFLLMYPAPEAVALTAMCSLTGQLFSIALLWRAIGYEFRLPLIAAGLLGAPLGSALLCGLNPHCVRVLLGALIVVSGLWRSLRAHARPTRAPSLLSEVFVGLAGGLTGGL